MTTRSGDFGPNDALTPAIPALRSAVLAIYWERLWPRLALTLSIAGVLFALVETQVLIGLPDLVRFGVATALALATVASAVATALARYPETGEAIARLERDAGIDHRPLSSLIDRPADGVGGPGAEVLWQAHRRRLAAMACRLRAAPPSPRLDRRDPYALRAVAFLCAVIGLFAARNDAWTPFAETFRLPAASPSSERIDVWVSPPAYTGAAPRLVSGASGATDPADGGERPPIAVPAGSRLTVRATGVDTPSARFIDATGAKTDLTPTAAPAVQEARDAATAFETSIDESGTLDIAAHGATTTTFAFEAIADNPPSIAFSEQPASTSTGALHLAYRMSDDYRVRSARAKFETVTPPGAPDGAPHPLYDLPSAPLVLPAKTTDAATTITDLSAHPLAGSRVRLTLEAEDDAGHVAATDPLDIVLPGRSFTVPLAAALAEQRRRLAADARQSGPIAATLDTLNELGAASTDHATPIIALRVIAQSLRHARSDDELRAAADLMWSTALGLEAGDAADAAEALRSARNALRDALDRGASPDEIARLADAVKAALDAYLQTLAKTMASDPSRLAELGKPTDRSGDSVTSDDMQHLVDRMKELSDLGNRQAARDLLSQLDDIIDNLKPGATNGADAGSQGPAGKALDQLAETIRRQLDLMNRTHRLVPEGRAYDGGEGDPDQQRQTYQDLKQQQEALADALKSLSDGLKGSGLDTRDDLGAATRSMRDAAGTLGEGDADTALGQEGEAVDALRRGAQAIAKAAQGEGQRQGRGVRLGGRDPLGRANRQAGPGAGNETSVPEDIEVQRARRLLDELRRRYSDPGRPPFELDYLKRLIEPFSSH